MKVDYELRGIDHEDPRVVAAIFCYFAMDEWRSPLAVCVLAAEGNKIILNRERHTDMTLVPMVKMLPTVIW
jgi:hypothetical protein